MKRWLALGGLVALAAVASLVSTVPAADKTDADWTTFRGPKRDGLSTDKGLLKEWPKDGPPMAWKEPAKGIGEGFSSVSVVGDKVFTMGDVGDANYVFALDRATGKKVWEHKVGKASAPGGYKGPRCTPTVDGDLLYALAQEGEFVCLKVADGSEVWRKDFPKDFGGRVGGWKWAESALVDGDQVVVTPGGKAASIVALNKKNGSVIWKCDVPGDHAEYSSMVIGELCGTRQYVQQMHDNIVGVNTKTGKLLWSYKKLGTTANIPTPVIVGKDHVLACAGYGKQVALIKITGSGDNLKADEVYYKNKGCKHGGMIMVGDYVYLDDDSSGQPYCAKVMTGDIAWKRQRGKTGCPGNGSASITYADGNLYIRYESGHMTLVEATPDGFKEKSWFKIPNDKQPSWSHPVVLGGRLYIRSQDQLLCYDVSAAK